jgi:hypothetical protein
MLDDVDVHGEKTLLLDMHLRCQTNAFDPLTTGPRD